MNPFYDDMKKKKVVSEEDTDSETQPDENVKSKKSTKKESKKDKQSKKQSESKKDKSKKKEKKQSSSDEGSEGSENEYSDVPTKKAGKQSKSISDEDRAAIISPIVENDRSLVKKAIKIINTYRNGEINEKKVINRMIKVLGVEAAKSVVEKCRSLLSEEKLADKLDKAVKEYNWPSLIDSIEDQFKEEKYEDNDDEATVRRKLINDYNDIRKNGSKLRKRVVMILKQLEKGSDPYLRLREQKKTLDTLQEECDRCVDESNVDLEELGELILQYSECVNTIISLLNEPMSLYEEESDSDTDKKKKKVRLPKFDDDDDDDSESARLRIKQRKAVYKAIIKEPNGKLSMSHITLDPRAQAGIPLPVKKDEVIGFGWKEETGSRMLFRCVLSCNGNDDDVMEIVPLQVRISEYHMILRIPEAGVLRLGWDNSLSIRKSKEIDIFVKRFSAEMADEVMKAEEERQEAWRQVERSDLTEGNVEGGHLTLKLTERAVKEDGVKYICHCDWESAMHDVKAQWDVQYPYLVWLEWYNTLKTKYPSHIAAMAPFSGTAFMTTPAVVEERLTKINQFFQDLVQDRFMMESPEVVCWFRCQEYIRLAKKEHLEKYRMERERRQKEEEEEYKRQQREAAAKMPNEDEMTDPLSYLCYV